jgi:hypothetical protein
MSLSREIFKLCFRANPVSFHVPDDIWKDTIPPEHQSHVVCISCFTRLADEKLIPWDNHIRLYPVSMNTHLKEIYENPQIVIVKGFRGEPALLKCIGIENLRFIIVGNNKEMTIRLKKQYVYNYDKKTYERLKKLFESDDCELLDIEWGKTKHYKQPESEG